MKNVLTMLSCVGIGAALSLALAAGEPRGQTADEVIAITKAEWAANIAKNASASMKNIADDCTIFTPNFPSRLDGKTQILNLREAEAGSSGTIAMSEMSNEKVQVYGDVAILSYNYLGLNKDKDGKMEPVRAKSSRVYVKERGQWWLVHANFAPADAPAR